LDGASGGVRDSERVAEDEREETVIPMVYLVKYSVAVFGKLAQETTPCF
jgi:hypothetical protein